MTIEETAQKIRDLKIQGAETIAIEAVKAFGELLKKTRGRKELEKAADVLKNARVTEPALRNSLRYCLLNYEKDPNIVLTVLNHFSTGKEKIVEYGSQKIQNNMAVFTHCHSSTVTAILRKAFTDGKRFTVYQTETRPRYQGRLTAQELSESKIPVVHAVDSAGRLLIKKADLFLFGADSISAEGNIINKIGTFMLAEFAKQHQIPVYSCTNSWKFNPETVYGVKEEIEERDPKEVWEDAPQGVKIFNPAFEVTPADSITGIITELGIFKPATLITEIQKAYPWLIT